jgi:capsular exopolysaccharide synthesis family protein
LKRYFPNIKRYAWVLLISMFLATLIGAVYAKAQGSIYQATSMIQVDVAPSDGFLPAVASNDAIALASDYSSTIMSRSVMDFVYNYDPKIKAAGYGPDDLLTDITTSASATAPIISITATTRSAEDTAMLANDVANGFNAWQQQQNQAKLDAQRTALTAEVTTYQNQVKTLGSQISALPATNVPQYSVLLNQMNDAISNMHTAESALVSMPTKTSSGMTVIHLVTPADAAPPTKGSIIIGITALIGLLIGVLVMMLLIYLDNRLFTPEQVKDKVGLAYLGGLARDGEMQSAPTQARGAAAHEIADIGANLRLTGVLPGQWRAPNGVILLVTSVQSTEGKTTIASALAAAMARGGCSTLIIDGNLRQPATHFTFGMNPSGIGLSGLLKSGGSIDDAVKTSPIPGVWLLPAGAPIEDPTLLLAQRFPNVLAQLRKKTDLIIIDGPALLTGAEAGVLSSMADGVMIVVDYRHGRIPMLLRAKDIVASMAHAPAGVVLNSYPRGGANRYFASALPQLNGVANSLSASSGQEKAVAIERVPASSPALPSAPAPMAIAASVPVPMPAPPMPAPAQPAPVAANGRSTPPPQPAPAQNQGGKASLFGYSNSGGQPPKK